MRTSTATRSRIAAAFFCFLTVLSGACFLNGSLDSYEGTVTSLLPPKVGDYSQLGEISPISRDTFVPELKSLIRNAGSLRYRRGDDSVPAKYSFVGVSVFVLFAPEQAKRFIELNKEAYLKQGFTVKEEAPRNRRSVSGERLVMVPSSDNESDRNKEAIAYWRNGSVVFLAKTTGEARIEEAQKFEGSFPY